MPKIREKHILLAEIASSVFDDCPATCLFGECCQGYLCFFHKFAEMLQNNDAFSYTLDDFMATLQEYFDDKPSEVDFFRSLSRAVLVFYFANGRKIPFLNIEIAGKMIIKAQSNPHKFFRKTRIKLFKLNPFWLKEFPAICRKNGVEGYFWNMILLFLALLMKAEEFDNFCKKEEERSKTRLNNNPGPIDGELAEYSKAVLNHLQQTRRAS